MATHPPSSRWRQDAWRVAVYLILAALLQMLARAYRVQPGAGVWYWAPALTVAFALTSAPRLLWATFIAPIPHQMLLGQWGPATGTILTICLAHGCAYGLGSAWMKRWGLEASLRKGRDLTLFLIYAGLAPLAFSIPAGWALSARSPLFGDLFHRITILWGEDTVGLIGLTPALLVVLSWPLFASSRAKEDQPLHPMRAIEVLLQGMALAGVPLVVLLNPDRASFPLAYLGFLPLLWVALRWGFRGSAIGSLIFSASMGAQYVALGLPSSDLFELQILMVVMGVTSLVVGHLVDARWDHRRAMLHQGLQLSTLLRGTGAVPFEMEARTGQTLHLGRGALTTSGYPMDEWQREPFWGAVVDPAHLPKLRAYLQDLLNGQGRSTVELALGGVREPRWIEVSATLLGTRDHVGGFFHDITPRKELERKLANSEAYYRQLVDQSLIPTAVHQDGRFVYVNEAALQLLGYERKDVLGQSVNILIHPEEMDSSVYLRNKVIQGETVDPVERRLFRKDGSLVSVDLLSIPCQHEGRAAAQVLAVDLTARKTAEAALKERIREKELVIREIHHRVKNNLQVVSSLLRLQASMHEDPIVKGALEQAQGRIHAIAGVHQRLHQAPSLAPEDLQEYVRKLVDQMVQTFAGAPARLQIQVEIEPLALGADQLVPLGLILHEMMLNTLRHAFPEGASGHISVRLSQQGDRVHLDLQDDGVGLPEGASSKSGGLGFQLIGALADQMKGQLTVPPTSKGTHLRVSFPCPSSPPA